MSSPLLKIRISPENIHSPGIAFYRIASQRRYNTYALASGQLV